MKRINIENHEFLYDNIEGATFAFSTSKGHLNFNKAFEEGRKNLESLKHWFSVKEVGYLTQIHSDLIYKYDGTIHEGDSLITDKSEIAIGVFTADCVPVLLYDPKTKVIAAIHSGWKGTLSCIVLKTLESLQQEFNCNPCNVIMYIGPHNRSCCYEIGKDVKEKFNSSSFYKGQDIFYKNNLNLENCIALQALAAGVKKEKIFSTDICTFCNNEYDLFSHRKNPEKQGRLFSFIYLSPEIR